MKSTWLYARLVALLLAGAISACGGGAGTGSTSDGGTILAPTALGATPGNQQVSLVWTASAGAASYSVFVGTTPGGESAMAAQSGIAGTSTVITGLSNGIAYYFKVRAVNGAAISVASIEVAATPAASGPTSPAAPAGLTATAGNAQASLSWTASAGASSYSVFVGTTPGGESATATQSGLAGTSATVTGLANGTTYYFEVKAVNSAGSSLSSNEATATPMAPVATPPEAPAGLTATPGDAQVSLNWTASAGAASYSVFAGTTPGGESATAVRAGIPGTSAVLTGLSNGVAYYFNVKAVNTMGSSGASNEATATPATSAPTTPLGLSSFELAQTHVLPGIGKSWVLANASESLHFVGQRDALALVKLAQNDASSPVLEGWLNGVSLGTVTLDAPSLLPPTEARGPAYAVDCYSATVPAAWMKPGLQLRASASNYTASAFRDVLVGADMAVTLRVLPFYLFGANDATQPFSKVAMPDATTIDEVFAKWPVAELEVSNHAAQRADWPALVVAPRADSAGIAQPAYVAHNSSEQKDGFASLDSVLSVLGGLLNANGEAPQAIQYYAPMILLDSAGRYATPGGGLGSLGGDAGAGDINYTGVFIHEQGHAMNLSHAGEAFDAGRYPYDWGSLKGSAWGFDPKHREFLAPFMPTTSTRYTNCASTVFAGHARALDASSRCVKQDPMQSGAGDQDPSYKFATFSDYTSAVMQHHFEGLTTVDGSGTHVYAGGYIVEDAGYNGGYKRWDSIDRKWVGFAPTTTNNAQYGFLQNFPVQKNVPVTSIVLTISKAGTAGATQIYPPLSYTGNLIRTVDPTDTAQRAEIRHYRAPYSGTGPGKWYCSNSGCDYTVRVTYANGTIRHVLLQGGFRNFDYPGGGHPSNGDFDPNSLIATRSASFRSFVINVPNDVPISRIDLLDTPIAFANGVPSSPTILATRSMIPAALPTPDHVVIVTMENHSYADIIGNAGAPYINALAAHGASFTDSHGVTHPSEPNYLAFFSGSTQGLTDDSCPHTYSTENLGHQLIAAGRSFVSYSEGMPSDGYTACGSGTYVRRHNPAVNFTNVPASANVRFSNFPTDFSQLPTVAYVVPDLCNDMHDCSVTTGDSWLQTHLDAYVQWAQTHNSLLILTFDEDDFTVANQIPTVFIGAHVKPGNYPQTIDHYNVLRTIEDLYGVGHAGSAASAAPITDIWQ